MVHEALRLAADTAPSVVGCSVSQRRDERFSTLAAWQELSVALDKAQYRCDVGPCLLAARSGRAQRVDDMRHDQRFQQFAAAAIDRGVLSSFSIPVTDAGRAAVNFYAAQPHAFDQPRHRAIASLLARCLERMLDDSPARHSDASAYSGSELDTARSRSAEVRTAVQLLMARDGLTQDAAFAELTLRSRMRQRSVYDLARETVANLESAEGSS